MKTRTKRLLALFIGIVIIAAVGILYWRNVMPSEARELKVALYQYVPDVSRFEKAIEDEWKAEHPDIELTFASWDCYSEDPPKDVDAFVFDSIFLAHLVNEGLLLPLPSEQIRDREDIIPYALSACTVHDEVYALPEFLCNNFLFTRKGDSELSGVTNVAELHHVLGNHTYEEVISSDKGLLMDLTGNTTKTLSYLQALMDYEQRYESEFPALEGNTLCKEAEESLLSLIVMGASWDSESLGDVGPYHHAKLFAGGAGRAYIGFSEAMSAMGDYVNKIDLRLISMTSGHDVPIFYADLAGINAYVDEADKAAAFDLLNVITGSQVMTKAIAGSAENPYPQYLLPARASTYNVLAKDYPLYDRLKELVETPDAQVMQLAPDGRSYLEQYKYVIGEEIKTESVRP